MEEQENNFLCQIIEIGTCIRIMDVGQLDIIVHTKIIPGQRKKTFGAE